MNEGRLIGVILQAVLVSRKLYFTVPYPQNDQFTVRDKPYGDVSRLVKRPDDKQIRVALRGLGGIGLVSLI